MRCAPNLIFAYSNFYFLPLSLHLSIASRTLPISYLTSLNLNTYTLSFVTTIAHKIPSSSRSRSTHRKFNNSSHRAIPLSIQVFLINLFRLHVPIHDPLAWCDIIKTKIKLRLLYLSKWNQKINNEEKKCTITD